ncbi:tail fiber protein [Flavobacterium sp. WG21]|uniref:tail fiber protein n=1 Tax=Flavobacterium sp. WG21 TaxID=1229487 RepID=UPI00034AD287|nr:tail fiber protein [Flavobacterium sp. WG21]
MKKKLCSFIVLLCSFSYSQTFDGNLGTKSLNWSQSQKDFNSAPRAGVEPMSIRLWDNYEGAGAPSSWGSLLEINGRGGHLDSQLYFDNTWNGGRILYRSAFFQQNTWESWRYLLDSKSDVESSGNLKIGGSGTSYVLGKLGIGTDQPNSLTLLDVNGKVMVRSNLYVNDIMGGNGGDIKIGPNTGGAASTIFMIGGADATEVMRIDYSKNVGIGTKNPDSKLTVAGDIHAREVKVTVNAGGVPDYVFANDYKLKSLREVEKYIKLNNHLPEIPSAQEIEKNGLMLAEMNLSLLKKIEELTLHAIEQQKNVDYLIKIVEEQNYRLNVLEKK